MPGGDRTGPAGLGPMTGRAMGHCAGGTTPGYANGGWGRGPGMGFGRGGCGGRGMRGGFRAGWRNLFHATGLTRWQRAGAGPRLQPGLGPEQDQEALKRQAEYLEQALGDVRKRLQDAGTEK